MQVTALPARRRIAHVLNNDCSDVFSLCDVMDALQRAAHSLHRDASTAAAATLAETIRQGCKDVQTRAVFLAQVHTATRVTLPPFVFIAIRQYLSMRAFR